MAVASRVGLTWLTVNVSQQAVIDAITQYYHTFTSSNYRNSNRIRFLPIHKQPSECFQAGVPKSTFCNAVFPTPVVY
jgi:hypothetical protein